MNPLCLQKNRWRQTPRVRVSGKGKHLPNGHTIRPYITLCAENALTDRLRRHPTPWLVTIAVLMFHCNHQNITIKIITLALPINKFLEVTNDRASIISLLPSSIFIFVRFFSIAILSIIPFLSVIA